MALMMSFVLVVTVVAICSLSVSVKLLKKSDGMSPRKTSSTRLNLGSNGEKCALSYSVRVTLMETANVLAGGEGGGGGELGGNDGE